mmetsp:Transcript_12099/g.28433  ORF Transcript_12099/g.28433 Transcript_12099/m.28433 type:complete len:261 (-) Transcript_12099:624-1406(-)
MPRLSLVESPPTDDGLSWLSSSQGAESPRVRSDADMDRHVDRDSMRRSDAPPSPPSAMSIERMSPALAGRFSGRAPSRLCSRPACSASSPSAAAPPSSSSSSRAPSAMDGPQDDACEWYERPFPYISMASTSSSADVAWDETGDGRLRGGASEWYAEPPESYPPPPGVLLEERDRGRPARTPPDEEVPRALAWRGGTGTARPTRLHPPLPMPTPGIVRVERSPSEPERFGPGEYRLFTGEGTEYSIPVRWPLPAREAADS